jgi:hypothetical protein
MGDKAMATLTIVRRIASSALHQPFNTSIGLARTALSISVLALAGLLSACSTSTPTVTNVPQQIAATSTPAPTVAPIPTTVPSPTVTSNPTVAPTDTSTPQLTATATSLDPCQLLPSQEASSLAGTSFGAGTEGTIPGGGKTCTYGSQSKNIFFVEVVQVSSEGLKVTQLPDFADGAVTAQANLSAGGVNINGSAFAFRKGTIFFGFSDVAVGSAAPDSTALKSEATTVLGRLP